MKHSEMATALRQRAADMQLIAIMDGDWEMPDEMVLTYISNFLTDPRLRRPLAAQANRNQNEGNQANSKCRALWDCCSLIRLGLHSLRDDMLPS
jgi:hypothetical protein